MTNGSQAHIHNIQGQDIYWRHEPGEKYAFIDWDNINRLLVETGLQGKIGLLSVDNNGNDYCVWEVIDAVNPAITVCEYGAGLGDTHQLTVPYRSDFQSSRAHYSLLYFGASLPAMIALKKDKGYTFVGTASAGCNAFFVCNDLADAVLDVLDGVWSFPSPAREARDTQGKLLFIGGVARAELIKDLPIIDLANLQNAQQTRLSNMGDLYSAEWRAGVGVRL